MRVWAVLLCSMGALAWHLSPSAHLPQEVHVVQLATAAASSRGRGRGRGLLSSSVTDVDVAVSFDALGQHFDMVLRPSESLFAADYHEVLWDGQGQGQGQVVYNDTEPWHVRCHYEGSVLSSNHSLVAAALCPDSHTPVTASVSHLHAVLWAHDQWLQLQPSATLHELHVQQLHDRGVSADELHDKHVVMRFAAEELPVMRFSDPLPPSTSTSTSTQPQQTSLSQHSRKLHQAGDNIKYLELSIVNDAARYFKLGQPAVTTDAAKLVNLAAQLFRRGKWPPPVIQLVLVSQHTFAADPYDPPTVENGEVSNAYLLNQLITWAADNSIAFDAIHMLSGYDFSGQTVGFATTSSVCLANGAGVEMTLDVQQQTAVVLAHEIGHNLGMGHDPDGCNTPPHIMSTEISNVLPQDWSACSEQDLAIFLRKQRTCMDNVPTQTYPSVPFCGNGWLEEGEQCDCGAADCSGTIDPCCNGLTCQLISTSQCSEQQPCCQNCAVVRADADVECASSADTCVASSTTCDGNAAECPVSLLTPYSTRCVDASSFFGACFEGSCRSHPQNCADRDSLEGVTWNACVDVSLRGDEMCSTLECTVDGSCLSAALSDAQLVVMDGVVCDAGHQCSGGMCVNSTVLMQRSVSWRTSHWGPCSKTCGGGERSREVTCADVSGNPSAACDYSQQPQASTSCNQHSCASCNEVDCGKHGTCGEELDTRCQCLHGYGGAACTEPPSLQLVPQEMTRSPGGIAEIEWTYGGNPTPLVLVMQEPFATWPQYVTRAPFSIPNESKHSWLIPSDQPLGEYQVTLLFSGAIESQGVVLALHCTDSDDTCDHGSCSASDTQLCDCDPGYGGVRCNVRLCNGMDCGGHGDCTLGECVCGQNWSGDRCQVPPASCPSSSAECFNGGRVESCQSSVCVCSNSTNYVGSSCSTCALACEHGRADDECKLCECDTGWAGAACQMPVFVMSLSLSLEKEVGPGSEELRFKDVFRNDIGFALALAPDAVEVVDIVATGGITRVRFTVVLSLMLATTNAERQKLGDEAAKKLQEQISDSNSILSRGVATGFALPREVVACAAFVDDCFGTQGVNVSLILLIAVAGLSAVLFVIIGRQCVRHHTKQRENATSSFGGMADSTPAWSSAPQENASAQVQEREQLELALALSASSPSSRTAVSCPKCTSRNPAGASACSVCNYSIA